MHNYKQMVIVVVSLISPAIMTNAQLYAQNESAATGKTAAPNLCIRLLSGPAVTINPVTGTGDTILRVRNQTDKETSLALIGSPSVSNSSILVEFSSDEHPQPTPVYEAPLRGKSTATVRMTLRNDWNDGQLDVDVTNHYGLEKVGTVHAARWPVSVKLEGVDRLKLNLLDGRTTRLYVRNDDPISYPISWRLVNGEEVCGDPNKKAQLLPKSLTVLECTPKVQWHASTLMNLLKPDSTRDGYHLLLLSESPSIEMGTDPDPPLTTFSGEASLDYYAPLTRGVSTYIVIILLLSAGRCVIPSPQLLLAEQTAAVGPQG